MLYFPLYVPFLNLSTLRGNTREGKEDCMTRVNELLRDSGSQLTLSPSFQLLTIGTWEANCDTLEVTSNSVVTLTRA